MLAQRANVSDKAMASVAKLTKLESLSLDSTQVSDKGLKQLDALENLSVVSASKQTVTSEASERFKEAHPNATLRLH